MLLSEIHTRNITKKRHILYMLVMANAIQLPITKFKSSFEMFQVFQSHGFSLVFFLYQTKQLTQRAYLLIID